MIIHIDGVQGSGKSYICNNIKNKKCICIDTDDIYNSSIDIIEKSQNTKNKLPRTFNSLKKVIKQSINDIIKNNSNKIIIFVGMTAEISNPDYTYFIKINDLVMVYKRLVLRELNKIISNEKAIKEHIKNENNPNEIDIMRFAKMSLVFPVTFKQFKDDYKERLSQAKKNKYKPLLQDEIIEIINKLD